MVNKNLKKAAAVTMAAAISLMGTIGASAEVGVDTINTSRKTSLTIYKYDQTAAEEAGVDLSQFTADGETDTAAETALANYALKGVEFTYLKVADIHQTSEEGSLTLDYTIPSALATAIGLDGTTFTSTQINDAMKTALADNTATKNTLENYVKNNGGTALATTDASGQTSASNLDQGLYLVVETKVPEEVHTTTDPFFVSLPMTDATGDYWNYDVVVYPKNQTNNPTIDKLVKQQSEDTYADVTTASEGDVLNYRVVTKLPTITSEATYLTKYTFDDALSNGIKYGKDVTVSFYSNEDAAKQATSAADLTWATGDGKFNATYDDSKNTMQIVFTADGLATINQNSDKYLVVAYTATVQSSADVVLGDNGNPNDVDLTYSRTNTTEENTIEDKANVYAFGINLDKTFSDGKGDATAVQFVLKNTTEGYYVTATGSDGVYYVTDGTQQAAEADATKFSPKADGSLIINGLEGDAYELTEIHTDNGYSLLKAPMIIDIISTVDQIIASKATVTGHENPNANVIVTNVNKASAKVDESATAMSADGTSTNARVDMSVVNTNSFTLPQTGGLGTMLFTIVGAIGVIIGVNVVAKKRREA